MTHSRYHNSHPNYHKGDRPTDLIHQFNLGFQHKNKVEADNVNTHAGTGADNNEVSSDIDSLQAELDSMIPDRDYAEQAIRTIKRTVKQEDSLVRQIFYTGISKDSANPINLAVLAPTSEGKTYPSLETLQYFPKRDVWKIGSMTPKVIIRQNGILVDGNNQPIEDRIKELKRKIKETDKDSEEREDVEQQLRQLLDEAKVLIDLRGKLWVFLEPPHTETWAILKPILSHDDFEIEHPYVYEVQGMGFKVKKVVTRGWPACVFCSAKNESNWPAWPEIQSRFLITSPNMVQEKYLDGNILIAQKMGLPNLLQQSIIVSKSQAELAKKCVFYVLEQIRQRNSNNTNPVWIPYASILAQVLPAEKGTDNRITKRILSFLVIITLARAHLRGRLEYGNESLAIANIDEDLHEVLHITQNLSGIPPFKLKVFKEVFFPLYKSKQCPNTDNGKQEKIVALTTRELCEEYNKKTGKTITTNNLKQNYLNEYIDNGLVDEEDSVLDKRQKIYYPLIELSTADQKSREEITNLSISDRMDNILQHPRILMPKNCINIPDKWLELEIFDLIKYPSKLDKLELYNAQNERICICKFVKEYEKSYRLNGYFCKPTFCNYSNEIFGIIKYSSTIEKEQCKELSNEDQMDNLVISDIPKTTDQTSEKVAEQGALSLTHSPAAYVLTNDDLEDIDGSSCDRGESL
jgi:hypothetical protein